jgi:hypothetical protein
MSIRQLLRIAADCDRRSATAAAGGNKDDSRAWHSVAVRIRHAAWLFAATPDSSKRSKQPARRSKSPGA